MLEITNQKQKDHQRYIVIKNQNTNVTAAESVRVPDDCIRYLDWIQRFKCSTVITLRFVINRSDTVGHRFILIYASNFRMQYYKKGCIIDVTHDSVMN